MRTVVVVVEETSYEFSQFFISSPGLVSEPFLEGAHKTFGDAIGLWSMACDEDMNKLLREHQIDESLVR